jgi:hypothetical protein
MPYFADPMQRRSVGPPSDCSIGGSVFFAMTVALSWCDVHMKDLAADTGLAETRIPMILMNPLYNGRIRRKRGAGETRKPAAWPGERPSAIDRARLERQMRELALDHAGSRVPDTACLERMAELRAQLAALETRTAAGTPASRAVEWLEILAETWQRAEVPEEKPDVVHAVYERIVVAGPEFVGVRLTPAAYSHGLAIALPEAGMARPTGVGSGITTYDVPIEDRDEWIAAANRSRSA